MAPKALAAGKASSGAAAGVKKDGGKLNKDKALVQVKVEPAPSDGGASLGTAIATMGLASTADAIDLISEVVNGPPCKLCKRGRTHRNTMPRQMPGPYLVFVSAKRALCRPCRNFCNQNYPGVSDTTIAKGIDTDEKQEQFNGSLGLFEEDGELAAGGENGGRRKRSKGGDYNPPSLVTAFDTGFGQGELMLGIFWPADVYKRETGLTLQKKEKKKYVHRGRTYWGIFRDPKHGRPIGSIRIQDVGQQGATHTTTVADTTDAGQTPEAVNDTFARLQNANRSSASVRTNKDTREQSVSVRRINPRALQRMNSDEQPAVWMDVVSGSGAVIEESTDEEIEEEEDDDTQDDGSVRKRRRKGSAKKARRSPQERRQLKRQVGRFAGKHKAKANTPSPSKVPSADKKGKYICKSWQKQELEICTNMMTGVIAVLHLARNAAGLKSLSFEKVEKEEKKVQAKLDDKRELLEFEKEGDTESLKDEGLAMLEKMRELVERLRILKNIARALKAEEKSLHFAPGFLYSEWSKAQDVELELSDYVMEVIVSRQAAMKYDATDISAVVKVLDHRVAPADPEHFGVSKFSSDTDAMSRAQETEFLKYLAVVLEAGSDDETWDRTIAYLKSFENCGQVFGTWLQSKDARQIFLAVSSLIGDHKCTAKMKESIKTLQEHPKAAEIFNPKSGAKKGKGPSATQGPLLLERAEEALRRGANDGVYEVAAKELSSEVDTALPRAVVEEIQGCKMVSLANLSRIWGEKAQKLATILVAETSDEFKTANKDVVDGIASKIKEVQDKLYSAQRDQFWSKCEQAVKMLVPAMQETPSSSVSTAFTETMQAPALRSALTEATESGIASVTVSKEDHAKVVAAITKLQSFSMMLQKTFQICSEGSFDIYDGSVRSFFHKILEVTAEHSSEKPPPSVAVPLMECAKFLCKSAADELMAMVEGDLKNVFSMVESCKKKDDVLDWKKVDVCTDQKLKADLADKVSAVVAYFNAAAKEAPRLLPPLPKLEKVGGFMAVNSFKRLWLMAAQRKVEHRINVRKMSELDNILNQLIRFSVDLEVCITELSGGGAKLLLFKDIISREHKYLASQAEAMGKRIMTLTQKAVTLATTAASDDAVSFGTFENDSSFSEEAQAEAIENTKTPASTLLFKEWALLRQQLTTGIALLAKIKTVSVFSYDGLAKHEEGMAKHSLAKPQVASKVILFMLVTTLFKKDMHTLDWESHVENLNKCKDFMKEYKLTPPAKLVSLLKTHEEHAAKLRAAGAPPPEMKLKAVRGDKAIKSESD